MSNRLLRRKNVVGYGPGIKRVNGEKTGEEAMLFFVEKKTNDISDADRIPEKVDGLRTDVIETGKLKPRLLEPCSVELMRKAIVPLRGGLAITPSPLYYGTLGAIVKDGRTGKLLAMTNAHVAGNPIDCTTAQADQLTEDEFIFEKAVTNAGLKMYQPDTPDGNQFGQVFKDYPRTFNTSNRLDVSLITIKSEFGVTPGIMGLTKYAQPFIHPDTVPVGAAVLKSGVTSGVTHGEILSTNTTVAVSYGSQSMTFVHQIMVSSDDTETAFAEPGDSGSALVMDLNDGRVGLIGVLHSGSDATESGSYSAASRLDDIVTLLGVEPWRGEIITANTYPEVVSTAFGAVYSRDSYTMLSVTNDTVCNGTVCGLGGLVVASQAYSVISRQWYNGATDLKLEYETIANTGDADVDVGLTASPTIYGGAECDTDVGVSASVSASVSQTAAANMDADVTVSAMLDADTSVGVGITADTDINVYLSIDPEISAYRIEAATLDVNVPMIISADAAADNAAGTTATADIDILLLVEPSISADVTDLPFIGPIDDIGTCTGENASDLFYGSTL